MPWATPESVTVITGRTVDEAGIARAAAVIESVTGLIESVMRPETTDRDLYWLKQATSYQAAWMLDNPDVFSRADVTSAGQDGESAAFRNVDAHLLAPLARKALRRLSFRQPNRAQVDAARAAVNVNTEEFDDSLPWRPM